MDPNNNNNNDLRPYDILCGRNRNSFNNIGNRRFRVTISMNVAKYEALRSRNERSQFIAALAQTLKYEVGFRFLKRKSAADIIKKKKKNNSSCKNHDPLELTDEEIRAKIGHALRDLSAAMKATNNDTDGSSTTASKVPPPLPSKKQVKKEPLKTFKPDISTSKSSNSSSCDTNIFSLQAGNGFSATATTTTTALFDRVPFSTFSEIVSDSEDDFATLCSEMSDAYQSLLSPVPANLLPSYVEEGKHAEMLVPSSATGEEDFSYYAPSRIDDNRHDDGTNNNVGTTSETSFPPPCCLSDNNNNRDGMSVVSAV
eukprot:scaffold4140_cov81-Cylindrotheca_fusiformis.AAC.6